MIALDKVSFLLFVCAGCAVGTDPTTTRTYVEEENPTFRHRFHKLDYLFRKISKLDEIAPREVEDDELNYMLIHRPKAPTTESFKSASFKSAKPQQQLEEPAVEDDDFEYDGFGDSDDEDYEEEDNQDQIKMIQHADELKPQHVSDLIEQYMADGENETSHFIQDPSQEDYDQESEYGSQADASPDSGVKWVYFGTREHLERSKPVHKLKRHEITEAVKHTLRMAKEGMCKIPHRRVFSIQNVYPNSSKTYVPHCTFLHRCGDDTGCCGTDTLTCMPKRNETVELLFYTKTVGNNGKNVEKLTFLNHTECECVPRKIDYMIKDEMASLGSLRSGPTFHDILDIPETETEAPIPIKRCQCPTEFSVRITEDGGCECDCYNRQRDCMRIKRGKEYFGLKDRICIQNGQCETPICEFGEYVRKTGRCPKRNDKFDEMSRHTRIFGNV